jgi:RNA polymerase sigma factor (sigma-70 family)
MQTDLGCSEGRLDRSAAASDARFLRLVDLESRESAASTLSAAEAPLECAPVEVHGTARQDGRKPSVELAPACAAEPVDRTPDGEHIPSDPVELAALRSRIVARLYERDYARVHRFARRLAREEVAEEVAHEAFVRLLRLKNLERMVVGTAYLLRIAENLLKRRHERAQRYRTVLDGYGMAVPSARGPAGSSDAGPATGGQAGTARVVPDTDRLQAAMGALSEDEQSAIRLIVCHGLDYQAAARSVGVPVSTINNWKHRGLAKLKKLVESSRHGAASFPAAAAG